MTRESFNDIVRQTSRKLYGFAFRILQNQEEAEDAVQEVFLKLWKMDSRLDKYGSIEALAITMTKNYCIDQFRKRKNIYASDDSLVSMGDTTNNSPLDQLEMSESTKLIHTLIARLPANHRNLIRLRDIDDLSYEEISKMTGQNINSVRVTLSRARKLIREEFNKYYYEKRGT